MKKHTKISLIVATALFLVGVLLFGVALAMADFDIRKLSNEKYELNTYDVDPSFDEIEIVSDISDITFTLSKDNTCRVLCHEREKLLHEVKVENEVYYQQTDESLVLLAAHLNNGHQYLSRNDWDY